jgi:sec-independent protein translocase protein TatB
MFDIGFLELLLIAVISLIVMGPKRLPEAVRSISLWLGRLKQIFSSARQQLEDEVGMDDVKRQLHNEQIMRDLKTTATSIKETAAITPEDNSR